MRHARFPRLYARTLDPARVKRSARALQREREALPLFAAEVAAAQPTPEERLAEVDARAARNWQRIRDHRAAVWRRSRARLAALPAAEAAALRAAWQRSMCPGSAEYLADMITQYERQKASEVNL